MSSGAEKTMDSPSFLTVEAGNLLDEVKTLKEDGWNFCQACADRENDEIELVYTFENESRLLSLKTRILPEAAIDSITFVFWTAFDAELDMARECGVKFRHVAEDHLHEFYDVADLSYASEHIRSDMEALTEHRDYRQMLYVVERMAGTSSFGNSLGYCMAVEQAAGIKVPERAVYLRVVLQELSRIQSHLYWFSRIADHIGFESLAMEFLAVREPILSVFDHISGNRIMLSVCRVGGLKKDIDEEQLEYLLRVLKESHDPMERLVMLMQEDASISRRLKGIGILEEKTARAFCKGPAARGSAIATDARTDEVWSIYESLGFSPVLETEGDGLARCKVAAAEIFQSVAIIEAALSQLPEGSVCTEVETLSAGEAVVRLEQPDGQAVYYVKTTDSDYIKKLRVSMPTDTNLLAYIQVMKACDPIDAPLVSLTMDPCRNGFDW